MKNKYEFAFLIHARNTQDLKNNLKFLKIFPNIFVDYLSIFFPPFLISSIDGLRDDSGSEVKGCIIACPMSASMMLKKRGIAAKKVLAATRLAEKLGAKIVGLGGFTSSVTEGGKKLVAEKVNLAITTGNALTAGVALMDFRAICEKNKIDIKRISVAIVGATGSIGAGLAKSLINEVGNLILLGKTKEHVEELANEMKSFGNIEKNIYSTDISEIKNADFVIMATASSEAVLSQENLKQKAIIYDLTQPRNVSEEILVNRPDLSLYGGGFVATPTINYQVNTGLPKGVSFACLSETMLLAAEKDFNSYVGKVSVDSIANIVKVAVKHNFKSSLVS